MMDDLFDQTEPAPRRVAYRQTSRLAWQSIVSTSAELDRAILAEIDAAGSHGIICAEIEDRIGRSHQSVSGNLRHLVEKNLVEPSGQFGRTPSGRKAMCWRIKENAA
jgi:predicted transcriptional regulator